MKTILGWPLYVWAFIVAVSSSCYHVGIEWQEVAVIVSAFVAQLAEKKFAPKNDEVITRLQNQMTMVTGAVSRVCLRVGVSGVPKDEEGK